MVIINSNVKRSQKTRDDGQPTNVNVTVVAVKMRRSLHLPSHIVTKTDDNAAHLLEAQNMIPNVAFLPSKLMSNACQTPVRVHFHYVRL